MRIGITINSSHEAKLWIDGREMTVLKTAYGTTMKGVKSPETEETMGGMVASDLYSKIADIAQAIEVAQECDPDAQTWDKLTADAAELFYETIQ
jgi:hypothetical protein